jgi:hypothetical protein
VKALALVRGLYENRGSQFQFEPDLIPQAPGAGTRHRYSVESGLTCRQTTRCWTNCRTGRPAFLAGR